MNIQTKNEYFKSSDFYLCCFLYAKGGCVLDIDNTNPRRSLFVFEKTPELIGDVDDFNFNRGLINPKAYAVAIKELKSRLYSQGH